MPHVPKKKAFHAATAALLAAALALVACAKDSPTAPPVASVVGVFTLNSVNGLALPALIDSGSYVNPGDPSVHQVRTVADSGTLELRADNGYHQVVQIREYVDGIQTAGRTWDDIGLTAFHAGANRLDFTSSKWQAFAYQATVGVGGSTLSASQNLPGQETGSAPLLLEFHRQ
jgi:hypothetical protein